MPAATGTVIKEGSLQELKDAGENDVARKECGHDSIAA